MKNDKQKNYDSMRKLVKSHGNLSDNHFSVVAIALAKIETKSKTGEFIFDLIMSSIIGGVSHGMVQLGSSDWRDHVENTAILTANQEYLTFYVLRDENIVLENDNLFNKKNIQTVFAIPYYKITKNKIRKSLFGYNIKIFCEHEKQSVKIKFTAQTRLIGVNGQKEEVKKLITHLKALKNGILLPHHQAKIEASQDIMLSELVEVAKEAETDKQIFRDFENKSPWDKY